MYGSHQIIQITLLLKNLLKIKLYADMHAVEVPILSTGARLMFVSYTLICKKLFNFFYKAGEKHKNDEMMDVLGNN